ncbi:MAG TPA: hypothetical protein VFL56_07945 [Solirubrobacterales bacterium]|nr:hypothetical protein [Solirubrobacterales bacterium]
MEVTTLETERAPGPGGPELTRRDRFGAWLYTGAPGRSLSFTLDLALSLAALVVWSGRRASSAVRRRLRRSP